MEKGAVLQETQIFSVFPIKPKVCVELLGKVLWLLTSSEQSLTRSEATDLFFSITKLFQVSDVPLRRMVYISLRELAKHADNVLMATAILSKDMNSEKSVFRANSVRTINAIIDSGLIANIERFIKQAIVDSDPYVSSSALINGIHLIKFAPDVVKRWVSEVQEALNSNSNMVQYHAVSLLYLIRQNDAVAITKLIHNLSKGNLRSPLARIQLIRYTCKLLRKKGEPASDSVLIGYIESCLRYSSEMVILEAAKQICELPGIGMRELGLATNSLLHFLMSSKAPQRFAAIKVFYKLSLKHPKVIDDNFVFEIRNLIKDQTRSIATLAVLTLLQVERESNVIQLLKETNNFIGEISDDLKITLVNGVRGLAYKYPSHQKSILLALSQMLKTDAGFDYKRIIVDTLLDLMHDIKETKDLVLLSLCDYIEDCEYTYLSTKILHVIGLEGVNTKNPTKFIRCIYNRIILEKPAIRSSAATALAMFGKDSKNVLTLLNRCKNDEDDLVRDKFAYYSSCVSNNMDLSPIVIDTPLVNIEGALENYLKSSATTPFDVSKVSKDKRVDIVGVISSKSDDTSFSNGITNAVTNRSIVENNTDFSNDLQENLDPIIRTSSGEIHSLFPSLGSLFKTSSPFYLTETGTEYQVVYFKHVFNHSIVLQFNLINSLPDQAIKNVYVDLNQIGGSEKWNVLERIDFPGPLSASSNEKEPNIGKMYLLLESKSFSPATFSCALKFYVSIIDDISDLSSNFQDQYQLDDLSIGNTELFKKSLIENWDSAWENAIPDDQKWFESIITFTKAQWKTMQEAVNSLLDVLSLQPCNGTEFVDPKKTRHILQLFGTHINGSDVIARIRMKVLNMPLGIAVELAARTNNSDVTKQFVDLVFH